MDISSFPPPMLHIFYAYLPLHQRQRSLNVFQAGIYWLALIETNRTRNFGEIDKKTPTNHEVNSIQTKQFFFLCLVVRSSGSFGFGREKVHTENANQRRIIRNIFFCLYIVHLTGVKKPPQSSNPEMFVLFLSRGQLRQSMLHVQR